MNFINEKENTMFSKMSKKDLSELIYNICNYYLPYRKKLDLNPDDTFGVEIEYEGLTIFQVLGYIKDKMPIGWEITKDVTLESGGEINSAILNDTESTWNYFGLIYDYLNENDAKMYKNAGGHVHVGAHILGNDIEKWKNFTKLYCAYENVLFRFGYGELVNGRKLMKDYAAPIAGKIIKDIDKIDNIDDLNLLLECLNNSKEYALNFSNVSPYQLNRGITKKNTVEYRLFNATKEKTIAQNNINTSVKTMKKVANGINVDYLDYKIAQKKSNISETLNNYNMININDAVEFVDLVFDNNLDKIYFLRQYLKDLVQTKEERPIVSRRFVK